MGSLHSITSKHQKEKHLSFEEHVIIQTRIKDGFSLRAIAREIGCSPSTISYEVKRDAVLLYNGKQKRYKAEQGNDVYHANHCLAIREFSREQIACTRTLYNYVA